MNPGPAITFAGAATIEGVPLFADLSLELVAGGWTCLLGPSGVGKSTILRLIAGLETGATFHGDISASDGAGIPDRVAYMAQEDLALPWATVRKNVALGARLRGEPVDQAALTHLLAQVGLEAHADKRPRALSGGQRQRVALARTLMEDKAVILLDEPFSALDARTRAEMQDLSFELLKGRTVLLVTHDPAEAARLGRSILVLSETGLRAVQAPGAPAPRPVDDPETLHMQGRLMSELRAGI